MYPQVYLKIREEDEVLNHVTFEKILDGQQSSHHDVETWKRLRITFIVISGFLCKVKMEGKRERERERGGGRERKKEGSLVQSSFISQRVILAVNMTIDPLLSGVYR